jgi:hypothetical protein
MLARAIMRDANTEFHIVQPFVYIRIQQRTVGNH